MTTIKEYETRAEKWALQSSTIIGAATIAAAAVGTGIDATTGQPWISAGIGLVVGGLTAILLPQQDPTAANATTQAVITGTEAVIAAVEDHTAVATKAAAAAAAAVTVVQDVAPKLAAQVQQVATQVSALAPIAEIAAGASGKAGVATIVGDVGSVLTAIEGAAKPIG